MSRPASPIGEDTVTETMGTEPTQETTGTAEATTTTEAKKAKAPIALTREPGKSVLPFSRVQKIMKADTDLVMVQREAAFLISRATEEFIGRFTEAVQRHAAREGRATVQGKDVVATVRRAEEFAFLEELFPWSSLEPAKRIPKAVQEKEQREQKGQKTRGPTMLDQFVSKPSGEEDEYADDDQGAAKMTVVTHEDGTLSMVPAESEPS